MQKTNKEINDEIKGLHEPEKMGRFSFSKDGANHKANGCKQEAKYFRYLIPRLFEWGIPLLNHNNHFRLFPDFMETDVTRFTLDMSRE